MLRRIWINWGKSFTQYNLPVFFYISYLLKNVWKNILNTLNNATIRVFAWIVLKETVFDNILNNLRYNINFILIFIIATVKKKSWKIYTFSIIFNKTRKRYGILRNVINYIFGLSEDNFFLVARPFLSCYTLWSQKSRLPKTDVGFLWIWSENIRNVIFL